MFFYFFYIDTIKLLSILVIRLQSIPHGPAITMIVKHPKIGHEISVDLSASIQTDIEVGIHGWPRNATRQVLDEEHIDRVLDAGVHLVPKHDCFWYISFSKAVTAMLRFIDDANECRRMCHKFLKTDFRTWQSQSDKDSGTGLKSISTYLFKVSIFIYLPAWNQCL